jgi:hypothetical protein
MRTTEYSWSSIFVDTGRLTYRMPYIEFRILNIGSIIIDTAVRYYINIKDN